MLNFLQVTVIIIQRLRQLIVCCGAMARFTPEWAEGGMVLALNPSPLRCPRSLGSHWQQQLGRVFNCQLTRPCSSWQPTWGARPSLAVRRHLFDSLLAS